MLLGNGYLHVLEKSYYNIAGMVPDSQKKDLTELWSVQSGSYLHRLTYSYGWRELPMEKEFLSRT